MIIFVFGTTAEAIKLAPVVRRLRARGVPLEQWLTYQHTEALDSAMRSLDMGAPDVVIARGWKGAPLKRPVDMALWLISIAGWTLRNGRRQRRRLSRSRDLIVVHGDTMTSVVGALLARVLGVRAAHVEAGLRSGHWRHPFPEELDRRIVGRLAHVHYAPSTEAVANLRGRKNVVFTSGNTVVDAALDGQESEPEGGEPYGVVLLHRFEFISDPDRVAEMMRLLGTHSEVRLRVLVDAYARDALTEAIARSGRSDVLQLEGKLAHAEFVRLVRGASFVVTDSGGIQEETALYGVPTLVHRIATERSEGIGSNAVLSRWDGNVVIDFLKNYERYRVAVTAPEISPSDVIVDDLLARGFGRAGVS